MPRSNRYIVPQCTYHLTHRCHNQDYLLRFAKDRDRYRLHLYESLQDHLVEVLSYMITSNHVHLLAHSDAPQAISEWMHDLQGRMATDYNKRRERSGAFWQGRFHNTMIENGTHLLRCMAYIELNMVRNGTVTHPREWRWCSYHEWMGERQRFRIIEPERIIPALGFGNVEAEQFRKYLDSEITRKIEEGELSRESIWTKSVAVGSQEYLERVEQSNGWRRRFKKEQSTEETWVLRDEATAYSPFPLLGTDHNK